MAEQQIGTNSPTLTIQNTTLDQDGNKYYCIVSDSSGQEVTSVQAVLTVNPTSVNPPSVSGPSSVTITVGDPNPSFTVTASGEGPFSYSWQEWNIGDDKFLSVVGLTGFSGANTPTLTVSNPGVTSTPRRFRCAVTNSGGTTNSQEGTLTVNESTPIVNPPVINVINSDKTQAEYGETINFNIELESGTTPFTYTWYRESLEDGQSIIATHSNISSLSDSATTSLSDGIGESSVDVWCVVSNTGGTVTSNRITVTLESTQTYTRNETNWLWGSNLTGTGTTMSDITGITPTINLTAQGGTPTWLQPGVHFTSAKNVYFMKRNTTAGNTDMIKLEDISASDTLSIEMWINSDVSQGTESSDAVIISRNGGSVNYVVYQVSQIGNNIAVRLYGSQTNGVLHVGTSNPIVPGTLQHVVVSIQIISAGNGTIKIYVDGTLTDTLQITDPDIDDIRNPWDWALSVGAIPYGTRYWQGKLYLIRMFNEIMSEQKVYNNYMASVETT